MFKKFQALVSGGKKVFDTIKSVKPNVPVTKADKVKRDLRLATQKSKTSQVKLDNTIFRIEQQKKRLEDMQKTKSQTQTRPGKQNLAKGGRVGLKFGSRKSDVQKIKETFGPKGNVPNKYKGFSKLPEAVQQKINKKLAKKV